MEEKKQGARPVSAGKSKTPFWKRNPYIIAVSAFFGGFLLAALIWFLLPKGQQIIPEQYQAVYLMNGQMYFGKLRNIDGAYLYMTSPYMPETTNSQTAASDAASSSIVRVKSQLWGPEDSMAIRADQVVFWQNLRDDSKVSQAIRSKE